jgi:hypothetical protein
MHYDEATCIPCPMGKGLEHFSAKTIYKCFTDKRNLGTNIVFPADGKYERDWRYVPAVHLMTGIDTLF